MVELAAQPGDAAWQRGSDLGTGSALQVQLRSGEMRNGRLERWDGDRLTLRRKGQAETFVPGSVINATQNANTPNMNGQWRTPKVVGPESTSFWFDPTLFTQPATNTFGALGRNRLTGPGFFHLDFSLFRKFEISERIKAEFRTEAFNFSNTPKFNNPSGDITSPNFGKVTGVNGEPNGPRVIQLGLKVVF